MLLDAVDGASHCLFGEDGGRGTTRVVTGVKESRSGHSKTDAGRRRPSSAAGEGRLSALQASTFLFGCVTDLFHEMIQL